ncbi:hypothetical protein IT084_07360 [Desulfallas sp. Bu1-1]|uniref:hypothetical protein n=1 Tax=Desulfallas sp. Bu1-1 TaxID=2787620 RepID=UPI00189DE6F0|nr:hypothetical protein [Desulfallas sp. Bu1-1]MBF7082796.1 hypothetical protein [Desulfallas sp. Bu1-1]
MSFSFGNYGKAFSVNAPERIVFGSGTAAQIGKEAGEKHGRKIRPGGPVLYP